MEYTSDLVITPLLVFVLGFFIRRWINGIDDKIEDVKKSVDKHCDQNREEHKEIYHRIDGIDTRVVRIETKIGMPR